MRLTFNENFGGLSLKVRRYSNHDLVKENSIPSASSINSSKSLCWNVIGYTCLTAKIYDASDGFGVALTKSEIDDFLQNSKLNVRLGTVDKNDEPMIHPVWYYYTNDKIYIESSKDSQKIKNIRRRNIVYFTVDEDRMPYKGVRGKGIAKIIEGAEKVLPITEKMMIKYTGSLDNPIAKELMDLAKAGLSVAIEITPKYYSTWDYSRRG